MSKTRVPEGEEYWLIRIDINGVKVYCHEEEGWESDKRYFEGDNYFYSRKEAEAMAKKLRAVLKGADVIEMPSEEEISRASIDFDDSIDFTWPNGHSFTEGVNWLKSKIVK